MLLVPASRMHAQQVVQRGALGKPAQVLDETGQWTTPLLVASDRDVQIYMPDVSSPDWLKRNYDSYRNRGVYILSLFTFYKTPEACRANQIGWGLGDAAHLNAWVTTGYRVRRARLDPQEKSATLLEAVMVDQNGNALPSTVEQRILSRPWDQLDANTLAALTKANALVAAQMKAYAEQQQSLR